MATGDRFRIACLAAVALAGVSWIPACGDGAVEPPPPDPPRATTVTVTSPTARLSALGATVQLSAQVLDQNGRPMAGAAVAWSSGSAAIATVDASGLVAAVQNGTVTIMATSGSASGSAEVTVAQEASAVTVSPAVDTVALGDTLRLVAEASDANGHMVEGAEFGWSSSDGYVVTVDASGLVTGLGQGTANITAMAGEASGTSGITVTPIGEWGPANTFGFYTFPDSVYPLARIEWTMLPVQAPDESLHEKRLLHYWAMQFLHDEHGHLAGYAGFQSQGVFRNEPLHRRVVNFAIWDSDASNTDSGMVDTENPECRCHQIMLPYEWEEGTPYRFVADTGPSGETDEYRWWGLWVTNLVTDSTTFVGETRSWRRRIEDPPVSWGEDMHWWQTLVGNAAYECGDFESSSLAVLDVLADGVAPVSVHALTSGGEDATGPNGHRTRLCDSAVVYSHGTDVQHNLGHWSTPPRNVLGADRRDSR